MPTTNPQSAIRNPQFILALDIGTSSTRTALFDARGQRVEGTTTQQTYPLVVTPDGGAELDPAVLLKAVRGCLAQTMAAYRADRRLKGRAIAGVGVSCFWHSPMGTDAQGRPLTRIITWADSRCLPDAAKLRQTLSEKQTHARTGCMLHASFWPAKMRWMKRVNPRLFASVARWMSPAEWVQLQLAGHAHCAFGMATGTGLFDPSRLAWDPGMLKASGLSAAKLGTLSDEPTMIGGPLARIFPELQGVPWFPGIGDGAAHNLGSGATHHGLAAINFGTSAALRVLRVGKRARAPLGLFCYRVDAQRYLVGGAISNAGNLRAWAMNTLKLTDGPTLEAALAARPEPKHRLTVLPFLTAERAPYWNDNDTGVIHGLRQSTTALDILQALTEASYHRIALIGAMVTASEKTPPKLIISGGIQKSPSSLQRMANILGQTVHPNDEPEASLRGAAVLVLERLGITPDAPSLGKAVRPQARVARLYAIEHARHRALEAASEGQREWETR